MRGLLTITMSVPCLALAGCSGLGEGLFGPRAPAPSEPAAAETAPPASVEAEADSATVPGPASEEAGTGGAGLLGTTIASLGTVSEPGLWLKTPLVSVPAKGRVEYPEKGTSAVVDLIPLDGEPGAGSRISLAAMQSLGAGLTELPELRVHRLE